MSKDKVTEYIGKSLNILFISNPKRTSMGILLGVFIDTVRNLFTPLLKTIKYMDVQAVSTFNLMISGVFLVNLPLIFKLEKFPPEVERTLMLIKVAKKDGSISQIERRQMYRNLFDYYDFCIKVSEKVSIKRKRGLSPNSPLFLKNNKFNC